MWLYCRSAWWWTSPKRNTTVLNQPSSEMPQGSQIDPNASPIIVLLNQVVIIKHLDFKGSWLMLIVLKASYYPVDVQLPGPKANFGTIFCLFFFCLSSCIPSLGRNPHIKHQLEKEHWPWDSFASEARPVKGGLWRQKHVPLASRTSRFVSLETLLFWFDVALRHRWKELLHQAGGFSL